MSDLTKNLERAIDLAEEHCGAAFDEARDELAALIAALEAALAERDTLREALRNVSAVGVVQLFDTARDDVLAEFSLAELQEISRVAEHLRPAHVEHIYREGWDAAIDQATRKKLAALNLYFGTRKDKT